VAVAAVHVPDMVPFTVIDPEKINVTSLILKGNIIL